LYTLLIFCEEICGEVLVEMDSVIMNTLRENVLGGAIYDNNGFGESLIFNLCYCWKYAYNAVLSGFGFQEENETISGSRAYSYVFCGGASRAVGASGRIGCQLARGYSLDSQGQSMVLCWWNQFCDCTCLFYVDLSAEYCI
jgi:hypothetical protein